MATSSSFWSSAWRIARPTLTLLILAAVFFSLREPFAFWLHGDQIYDQEAVREWIQQARVFSTLPELTRSYLELAEKYRQLDEQAQNLSEDKGQELLRDQLPGLHDQITLKREQIYEHLKAMGNPPTKIYPQQLPLFPMIYRLSVTFQAEGLKLTKHVPREFHQEINWDSQLPRQTSQYRYLKELPLSPGASASVEYHLHAYSEMQYQEQQEVGRRVRLAGLGVVFALVALGWFYLGQRRERERDRHRLLAQQRLNDAERLRLHEELRREEAERRHAEAERQNLELRSQIFANIGIMAGSYAHNIKNLLVRPNDLLRRCLDEKLAPEEASHLLGEVRQTLGTVTERLQQILQTVRRDPTKSEKVEIDLNQLVREMCDSWAELAQEKWKLRLELETCPTPLIVEGDRSHLQQTLENLLFNARDATFEMRNHLREEARQLADGRGEKRPGRENAGVSPAPVAVPRREALIAAAGWKGLVKFRTRLDKKRALLEIEDNGIGMTEEVRQRCTETHFSTKRDNALFAGLSSGMGLGLAFVSVVLAHHGAQLEIVSQPLVGTTFRVSFPLVGP